MNGDPAGSRGRALGRGSRTKTPEAVKLFEHIWASKGDDNFANFSVIPMQGQGTDSSF